ncbi:MAG: RdgB/HAM1 family non-canonical purine NTP pyrophosphatase [Acidobacteriota bacterium]
MKKKVDLLVATSNPGKIREIRRLLKGTGLRVAWLQTLGDACPPAPKETGRTFAQNARLKARSYATRCGFVTFSEDSGLCVEMLGGAPGYLSARYLGMGASYDQRCRHVLRLLEGKPRRLRRASFQAAGAVVDPAGRVLFEATGRCPGLIAYAMSGRRGFGYDPIFYYPPARKTFAQMAAAEKNAVSHRARLLAKLRRFLVRSSARSGS